METRGLDGNANSRAAARTREGGRRVHKSEIGPKSGERVVKRGERGRNQCNGRGGREKEEERGREVGMLVSESHPLTPVSRRIVQSITPPSLSHHHLRGGLEL